ncbi:MAG: hypothetical protein HC878_17350 [Leptolyngbyaceae cyanobacterium SL_5_14]|nr:hypothetical protein [Leptolyngbyaceae cyanobacterium SL_5_14]
MRSVTQSFPTCPPPSPQIPPSPCSGLNCPPCLTQIFRAFEPIHLGQGIHTFSGNAIALTPPLFSLRKSPEDAPGLLPRKTTGRFAMRLPFSPPIIACWRTFLASIQGSYPDARILTFTIAYLT